MQTGEEGERKTKDKEKDDEGKQEEEEARRATDDNENSQAKTRTTSQALKGNPEATKGQERKETNESNQQQQVQLKPVRPNLRRQVKVPMGEIQGMPTSAELARVFTNASIVPPQRPNRLPSRYHAYASHTPTSATSKPNRYSWARMQQWHSNHPAQLATDGPFVGVGPHPTSGQQQSHFSSAASRVLVVNPMQIVNLSEHTKSSLIKFIEAVKRFSEKWFSHVLLLLFLAAYACLGAYIFISFEAPTEQTEKLLIIETRLRIVNESWFEANTSGKSRQEYTDLFRTRFEEYERLLNKACGSGITSSSLENQWTFWGALFYSMTVFTTIGYGHLTPITFAGRVATMIYAILGIPILLMVLADLGKLLTRIIKYAFKKFSYLFNKILRRKASIKTRKMISDNTHQYIGVAKDAFERGCAYIQPYNRIPHTWRVGSIRRKQRVGINEMEKENFQPILIGSTDEVFEMPQTASDDQQQQQKRVSMTTDVIVTPGKQMKPVSPPIDEKKKPLTDHHHHHHHQNKIHSSSSSSSSHPKRKISSSTNNSKKPQHRKNSVSRSSSSSAIANQNGQSDKTTTVASVSIEQKDKLPPKEMSNDEELKQDEKGIIESGGIERIDSEDIDAEYEEDEENDFDIPVSFALFLLVFYMMFGAVVFSIWEGWNFFDSLYFVFISMSTIGFGDLVPQHPKRMIGTFIYLLFGLALTSMCINVVQEKIHATFLRAKMQIGEKMGLDLEQIMADDYYNGSMGMEGDEEDDNSIAVSQTNSIGHSVADYDLITEAAGSENANTLVPKLSSLSDGGKSTSKSARDSSKPKRRSLSNFSSAGIHGGSIRRKPSKKITRQMTPSASSAPAEHKPVQHQVSAVSVGCVVMPFKTNYEVKGAEKFKSELPGINQPIYKVKGFCEPLSKLHGDQIKNKTANSRPKLTATRSQPTVLGRQPSTSEQQVSNSKDNNNNNNPPKFRYSNHDHLDQRPRRASVSNELEALDDLIVALSQSPAERFGPLLGIPSSRRSSRSSSPASLVRRGTSMTSRPTASSTTRPIVQKKRSMIARSPPPLNLSESQAALDELESIKFSAV